MKMMRINKYLSENNIASRRHADELIKNKLIRINGKTAKLGDLVSEQDVVSVEQITKKPKKIFSYIMLYKPSGISSDPRKKQDSVLSLLDENKTWHSLVPLSVFDEGLLLLTDDYLFFQKYSQKRELENQEFVIETEEKIIIDDISKIQTLLKKTQSTTENFKIRLLDEHRFAIILKQFSSHELRRLLQSIGLNVIASIRTRLHTWKMISTTPVGHIRNVSEKEMREFTQSFDSFERKKRE